MGKIQLMIDKLKREGTIEKQEKAILGIVASREAQVLDLNLSQLFEGKDSQGEDITPEYTPFTKSIKKALGQPADRVTLRDEGDFYRSFNLKVDKFPIMIEANDKKTPDLIEKYGSTIFGLDSKSKAEFNHDVKPELQAYYRSLIQL